MQTVDMVITGKKIRQKAEENGYTMQTLADKLDVTVYAVYKWYAGMSMPKVDNLVILKELFGCDLEDIVGTKEI